MAPALAQFSYRYDPRLVEEAVFVAVQHRPEEQVFHAERDRLYTMSDPEARDAAFHRYHAAWFTRLGLDAPVVQAFAEQPLIAQETRGCVLGRAATRRDEGAELFVSSPEPGLSARDRRSVGLLLRPEAFLDGDRLLRFLRHELCHIVDMLSAAFAYDPRLPPWEGSPVYDHLVRDRYRLLWDTTIEGRLVRRGWAPATVRDAWLQRFRCAFPMLGDTADEIFARFFDHEGHTHAEFVAFARNPSAWLSARVQGPHPGGRCPLCRFPTYAFAANPHALPSAVLGRISHDFPAWRPEQGLCLQCADLYRTRA